MTITINDTNIPKGSYTWVAILRDRTVIEECATDEPQKSFDVLTGLDVAEVHLIPFRTNDPAPYIQIFCQPGEYVKKVWVRTHNLMLDTEEQTEDPVIDKFVLVTDKPIFHQVHVGGGMTISTLEDQ